MPDVFVSFGHLESMLAEVSMIAPSKRTAFQARLKNIHRLGYPADLKMEKGRPTAYRPRDAARMALAINLAELGIAPDRSVRLLENHERNVAYACWQAAEAIRKKPDGLEKYKATGRKKDKLLPDSYFLVVTPFGLEKLVESAPLAEMASMMMDYSARELKEDLISLTFLPSHSKAIINVTATLLWLAPLAEDDQLDSFLADFETWAHEVAKNLGDT